MNVNIQLHKCNDCYTLSITIDEKPIYIRNTRDKELAYDLYYEAREVKRNELVAFDEIHNEIWRITEENMKYFPGCGMDLLIETLA